LDVIISVGYRVKSVQGTQFRIWATHRLRDYIIKGFRLKRNKKHLKKSQLERVRRRHSKIKETVKVKFTEAQV